MVVLVLVVNHTLWLCLCGGVGCGDHEWWHLALHQASHASAHCVALLLWWCPLVLLCHHQSFFLLPSCWLLKEWWWHLMRPVWRLMAHGWVYEGMGLVSDRKETGLAVWCFVLCGSFTLCVVPLFGTHHPLCLHTSHSNQPPLDGVVRWCESTTVPLSISLFTVCV